MEEKNRINKEKRIQLDLITLENLLIDNICQGTAGIMMNDEFNYSQIFGGNHVIRASLKSVDSFLIEAKTTNSLLLIGLEDKIQEIILSYNFFVNKASISYERIGASTLLKLEISKQTKDDLSGSNEYKDDKTKRSEVVQNVTNNITVEKYVAGNDDSANLSFGDKAMIKAPINAGKNAELKNDKKIEVLSNNNIGVTAGKQEKKQCWFVRIFKYIFTKRG